MTQFNAPDTGFLLNADFVEISDKVIVSPQLEFRGLGPKILGAHGQSVLYGTLTRHKVAAHRIFWISPGNFACSSIDFDFAG
jgi:hypothetical protein